MDSYGSYFDGFIPSGDPIEVIEKQIEVEKERMKKMTDWEDPSMDERYRDKIDRRPVKH